MLRPEGASSCCPEVSPSVPLQCAGQRAEHQPCPAMLGGAGQPPCQGCRAPAPSTAAVVGWELFLVLGGGQRALSQQSPCSVSIPHPPSEEGSGSALRWLWDQPGFAALELLLQREAPVSTCPPAPSMRELPLPPPPPPPPNRGRPALGLSCACEEGGKGEGLRLGKRKSRLRLLSSSLFMWC